MTLTPPPRRPTGRGLMVCAGWGMALLLLGACGGEPPPVDAAQQPAPAAAERRINVGVLELAPRDFTLDASYVGHLLPAERVALSSEREGVVERLLFEEGDRVRQGQPLVHISTEQLTVRRNLARSNLELAEANFRRDQELRARNLIPQADLDTARNRREVARYELELAELELKKSVIVAPLDGTVNVKGAETGEFVSKGALLAEILDIRRVRALVQVSDHDLPAFAVGKTAQVWADALPEETFTGKVTRVGLEADLRNRAFPVEIDIPNGDGRLRPGMLVRARVQKAAYQGQVVIPRNVVLEREEGRAVYVVENGRARLRPITLGASVGSDVQVVGGLDFSDELIVSGHTLVAPDDAVLVRKRASQSPASR